MQWVSNLDKGKVSTKSMFNALHGLSRRTVADGLPKSKPPQYLMY